MPTKENSLVEEYIPCPKCFAMFKENDFRAHWRPCSNLNSQQQRNQKDVKNIKTQLRRLGRLKAILKVKNLSDVLQPGWSEQLVAAIEKMAADPANPSKMKYPTVAQNMATLVKAVTNAFRYQCLKKGEQTRSDAAAKFVDCFADDYYHLLSHHARDAHRASHAQKIEEVPLPADVKKFYLYLCHL